MLKKKINESFVTLNYALKQKKVEEDECDVYAKLLAKRLRKYPERLRDKIMYKIDGFLLDNPYPDERPSSACSYYSSSTPSPYYQNSTPSPANTVSHVIMPEVNEIQHIPRSLVEVNIPEKKTQRDIQPANLIENAYLNAVTTFY